MCHRDAPALTLCAAFAGREDWAKSLRDAGIRVRMHPEELDDLGKVEFAICWQPDAVLLQRCSALKAIQSMGAGVDSILSIPEIPRHVPLLRVIDPLMAERMATWVLWGVINSQRRCDAYAVAQRQRRWGKDIENYRNIDNAELRVGVMGLGVMGGAVADALVKMGYSVSAWTRRRRQRERVLSFDGVGSVKKFASQADVVVCLLPLTHQTKGILNGDLFTALPRGSTIINAARGGHLVEDDLVAALDSGHIASAILDVFEKEPLSEDSPLWNHPSVRIFPHVSSMTNMKTAIDQMLRNRDCILDGRALPEEVVVDWDSGY